MMYNSFSKMVVDAAHASDMIDYIAANVPKLLHSFENVALVAGLHSNTKNINSGTLKPP